MIRIIKQRLIIPQGDTGTFSLPLLPNITNGNAVAVFSIFNLHKRLYQQEQQISSDTISFILTNEDTKDLPLGDYFWDVKIYTNPEYKNNKLINGDEVHSYYAGFKLPQCSIVPYSIHDRG